MGGAWKLMGGISPDIYCTSVLAIDAGKLVKCGTRAVLLDLDNTLLARGAAELSPEVAAWVCDLSRRGLGVVIVSNSNNERCERIARQLGVAYERNAFKPFVGGLVRACAKLGVPCGQAVMVGDQSYTDVLGAHRAGMRAIMVEPLSEADPLHTRFLRCIDRFATRGMRPYTNTGR